MHNRICPLCGEEFTTRSPNRKFCYNHHTMTCKWCGKEFIIPDNKLSYYYKRKDEACCCKSCSFKLRYSRDSKIEKEERSERRRKTCLERYGVDNVSKSECVKKKKEQTSFDHYGVGNPFQSEQVRTRYIQSCQQRYGVDNYFQTEEFKEKSKQTSLERYGTEHPSQSDEVKEKIRSTTLDRYGVEFASQSKDVQKKIEDTSLSRYGTRRPSQSDDVKNKIARTNINRYGYPTPLLCPEIRDKISSTISSKYGVDNVSKSKDIKNKKISTCLRNYGVEWPSQSSDIRKKQLESTFISTGSYYPWQSDIVKRRYLSKTGFMHPSQNPEVRCKINKSVSTSKLELRVCNLLDNYGINHIDHYCIYKYEGTEDVISHEFDIYLKDYNILIDCDGLYYHGYSDDSIEYELYSDSIRLSLIPKDSLFVVIVEGHEIEGIKYLIDIISKIDEHAFDIDTELFDMCRSIDFPYPKYTKSKMLNDWNRLCAHSDDSLNQRQTTGNTIIKNFHKSIYNVRVGSKPSIYEAWKDDTLLKQVILNRNIYIDPSGLDPSKILQGFNISKIAPRASIFSPCWARYLITKYLYDFETIFDPFSGFSGRLLGTCSLGKTYIGSDLNNLAVEESNNIIEFLNIQDIAKVHCSDIFDMSGSYPAMLTCPPYGDKEIYSLETEFKSCDDWIDEMLSRFTCDRYVFVVGSTDKYQDNIVEEIDHKSFMSHSKEYVIVI